MTVAAARHPAHRSRTLAAIVSLTVAALLPACGVESTADRSPGDTGDRRDDRTTTTAPRRPPADDGASGTAGSLEWEPCGGSVECASLDVPVDHGDPEGATLSLALLRRPAEDPDRRIGSLLVNPGGPGGSAVDLAAALVLPDSVMERFDLVGFDPRGVGGSQPLDCTAHLQDLYDVDPTLEDDADRDALLEISRTYVDACAERYGDLLPHLGTVDVARDMDLVRRALGEDQISYLGYSYGTSIGQQYARLFPGRVRAMVLDGVVDLTNTGLEGALGQAAGFTEALDAFAAACDDRGCGLDRPAADVVDDVLAASEEAPIPAPGADRDATPGVVNLGITQALYSEYLWPDLAAALESALDGDATGLVDLADQYLQREIDGDYTPGTFEIYFAVSCLDSEWPDDPDDLLTAAEAAGERYPRFGEALVNDYVRCPLWPVDPAPLEPVPTDLDGLAPVVVVSTTGDPATPYQAGVDAAERIPGAVLVTNEGEGHTIVGQGEECIDDAVAAYLVDLDVPDDGLTCP